jgi:hypothetical protein
MIPLIFLDGTGMMIFFLRHFLPFILIILESNGAASAKKIGSTLLIHALRIGYEVNKVVPLYAVALRSLNDDTTRLYAKYGFVKLPNSGNPPLMVLPIWSVIDLFAPRSN